MQIKIVFDTGYELTVDLIDNDFVKRWCRLLSQEIERGTLLQEDTFSNFIPESLARQRLEQSIDTVNKFLQREFISIPQSSDYDNPEFYNQLHKHFKELVGTDSNQLTRLMLIAPSFVKSAIQNINRYCCCLEKQPYCNKPEMKVEFNTYKKEQLLEDEYKLFDAIKNDYTVVLDCSNFGKSLYECYEQGLTPDYAGLTTQHQYSANFILKFEKPDTTKSIEGFKKWLEEHNITEMPSAIGHIQLGNIADKTSFEKVKQSVKIVTIKLE